jgi:hypothetical protein
MGDGDKSLDILGIKPIADAVSTVTQATTDGVGAILSRICLPAAQEFGLLLQDKVRIWRVNNLVEIVQKAEHKLRSLPNFESLHAHPRLVGAILEHGSWEDEPSVQDMWAGLLASGCTNDGRSQENSIFVGILSQLTANQVRILEFACTTCTVSKSPSGLAIAQRMNVPFERIFELTGTVDVHTLDLEFDRLRTLGLFDLSSGMHSQAAFAAICPTAIGLRLHMRARGATGSPIEFYRLGE